MKKTLISFILDETGSMLSVKDETIFGFNEWLETVRYHGKSSRLTLTCFNSNKMDTRYVNTPVKDVEKLTPQNYKPDAMTPLYDAIGTTINVIEESIGKVLDKPDVLIVILTDGQENFSKEYNRQRIFDLIQEKQREGWAFIYLGANQDSWLEGEKISVPSYATMDFAATSAGISSGMATVANYTASYLTSDDRSSYYLSTSLSDFDTSSVKTKKNSKRKEVSRNARKQRSV